MGNTVTIALVAIGLACLLLGPLALTVFLTLAGIVAGGELFRLARMRGVRPIPIVGFLGIAGMFLAAHARGEQAPQVFPAILAGAAGLAFVAMLARRGRASVTIGLSFTVLVVTYIGLLGAYVVALRRSPNGFRVTLALLAAVAAYETGAWLASRLVARRPRGEDDERVVDEPRAGARGIPAFLGGAAATLLVGVVAALALDPPFTWPMAIVLAALVAVASPAGHRASALARGEEAPPPLLEEDETQTLTALDPVAAEPPEERAHRPAPRAVVLEHLDGLLVAAPIFFYAYRALAR